MGIDAPLPGQSPWGQGGGWAVGPPKSSTDFLQRGLYLGNSPLWLMVQHVS